MFAADGVGYSGLDSSSIKYLATEFR
jgi:hypothetical protein